CRRTCGLSVATIRARIRSSSPASRSGSVGATGFKRSSALRVRINVPPCVLRGRRFEHSLEPPARAVETDGKGESRYSEHLRVRRGADPVPGDEPEHLAITLPERRERGESLVAMRERRRGIRRMRLPGAAETSCERVTPRLAPELARDHLACHAEK